METSIEEASAIKKAILDSLEDGYEPQIRFLLDPPISVLERLEKFLTRAMKSLELDEFKRFHIFPKPVPTPCLELNAAPGGRLFALDEYLHLLDEQSDSAIDIAPCFKRHEDKALWESKTRCLMEELSAFVVWVARRAIRNSTCVPVPLLRDALLTFIGIELMRRHGVEIAPSRPALFNRCFINKMQSADVEPDTVYLDLLHVLYGVLLTRRPQDETSLQKDFARAALNSSTIPRALIDASRRFLDQLGLDGPPLFIETGTNGSIPLWLLAVSGGIGDMVLHTTYPWLNDVYDRVVFRKRYHYLQDLETIAAHEYLFQLEDVDGDANQMLVRETGHEHTRRLALWEIYQFKKVMTERLAQSTMLPDQ